MKIEDWHLNVCQCNVEKSHPYKLQLYLIFAKKWENLITMNYYVNICNNKDNNHRVFAFIVGIQFWHICFSWTFPFLPYSHTLLVFLSLSLSLTVSLYLSPTHSPIYLSLSYSPHLSLSHSPFSLSTSFPPFLSFQLRLFNLFNDHSPSPHSDVLTHYAFCVRNALWLLYIF